MVCLNCLVPFCILHCLDRFFGPESFLKGVFWNFALFFLAAIIFIRFFLCLALLDSDFFWPQSFLKAVTKKERTKQLSQTIEKIQLHSWWITVAT